MIFSGAYLDVGTLLAEHHTDCVNILRLSHERCGDEVHPVNHPEVLEIVDVLPHAIGAVCRRVINQLRGKHLKGMEYLSADCLLTREHPS